MSTRPDDGFALITPGQTYLGKQGIVYGAGASKETVGAQKICMNVMPMPPGAVAKAHYHKDIETIAYMLRRRMRGLLRRPPGKARRCAPGRAVLLRRQYSACAAQ